MELLEINEESMTKQQIQRRRRANKLKQLIIQKQFKVSTSESSTNEDSEDNMALKKKNIRNNKQTINITERHKTTDSNSCNSDDTTVQYRRKRRKNLDTKVNGHENNKNIIIDQNNNINNEYTKEHINEKEDKNYKNINSNETWQGSMKTKASQFQNGSSEQSDQNKKEKSHDIEHGHQRMVECPNRCGEKRIKKKIATHRQSCILQLTKCDFYSIGCNIKVVRNMLKNHNDVYANIHHLLKRVQKLDEAIEKLKFDGYLMQRQFHNNERKFLQFLKRFEATKI